MWNGCVRNRARVSFGGSEWMAFLSLPGLGDRRASLGGYTATQLTRSQAPDSASSNAGQPPEVGRPAAQRRRGRCPRGLHCRLASWGPARVFGSHAASAESPTVILLGQSPRRLAVWQSGRVDHPQTWSYFTSGLRHVNIFHVTGIPGGSGILRTQGSQTRFVGDVRVTPGSSATTLWRPGAENSEDRWFGFDCRFKAGILYFKPLIVTNNS